MKENVEGEEKKNRTEMCSHLFLFYIFSAHVVIFYNQTLLSGMELQAIILAHSRQDSHPFDVETNQNQWECIF